MDILCVILPLIIGWILDKCVGDPSWLPHPIVGFGKMIHWGEIFLNRGQYRKLKGGLFAVVLIVGVFVLCKYLLYIINIYSETVIYLIIVSIGVFYCLAGTTLSREVRWTFEATDRSVEEGRNQIARIVGRDTSELSSQEIRVAALETLSENLSDGVIAPLFWYLILGIEGMFAYKMINTLDSMIGYRNDRYCQFGCVAAHIDDLANYIPARLTAILMILVSGKWSLFKFVRKYGRQHISPNSGYPESALAGILNCRFGGPHNYFGRKVWKPFIGSNERPLHECDMQKSININQRVEILMISIILLLQIVFLAIKE